MTGDFFTVESFSTLAGTVSIVYVVSNVIQHVFNFNPRWFGLLLSFIFAYIAVAITGQSGASYIIAFLNGFLIYASVVGIVQITGREQVITRMSVRERRRSETRREFMTRWY